MITIKDIDLLERYGTLGISTSLPRDTKILDGSYEDARKEFYANIKHTPNWIYHFNADLLLDADVTSDIITEIGNILFCLPHVHVVKTKVCPLCKTTYGGKAQVCKHCPERLVYIDTGKLVPLVEVAVPPHADEDITYWYTHIHVYLDGVEFAGEVGRRCHYANAKKGYVLVGRDFEHLPDETVYGDVEIVFGVPDDDVRGRNK